MMLYRCEGHQIGLRSGLRLSASHEACRTVNHRSVISVPIMLKNEPFALKKDLSPVSSL